MISATADTRYQRASCQAAATFAPPAYKSARLSTRSSHANHCHFLNEASALNNTDAGVIVEPSVSGKVGHSSQISAALALGAMAQVMRGRLRT